MSYFINSNLKNNEFELISKDHYFVDKTRIIHEINALIGVKDRFICITRPRRFGKTINAMMLASYYSKAADYRYLFDPLQISQCPDYLEHLNRHNVVSITFSEFSGTDCTYDEFISGYKNHLIMDLKENFGGTELMNTASLSGVFRQIYDKTGQQFIFIIDEWDYIFNNKLFSEDDRKHFLDFLRDLLKDRPYVELVYMTGVLPIAKYSSGSTLNMFDEYTFLNDTTFHNYFGFTHSEVAFLCQKQKSVSMDELREWYDGYRVMGGQAVYNPRSVVLALKRSRCQSYWTNTGPMDELLYYIDNDIDSVKNDIVQMAAGIPLEINLKGYSAEQLTFDNRNQILSAMTIYGFLSYDQGELRIPNKELRIRFDEALEDKSMGAVSAIVLKSDELLKATLRKDTQTMENLIQEAHDINIPIIKYNDENSLACVITLAYLNARSTYNIVREAPAGIGFADFIFYPVNKSHPAFIIELKKDSSPDEALRQIEEKRYALALRDYTGEKFAVGISYDSNAKIHHVKIKDFS